MFTFGLLGIEYDGTIQYLKRHIEDRGHKTTTINLTHLPRVVHSTVSSSALIHDDHDLLEFDCFYLSDMGVREPFFHVTYDRELWSMLRERYLKFASDEIESVNFTAALLNVLAATKPMINPPAVYSHRLLLPFHLHRLNAKGFKVPSFRADIDEPEGFEESGPLKLDEDRTWEVLSFPKTNRTSLRIWKRKPGGVTYKVIVLGDRLLDEASSFPRPAAPAVKIRTSQVPREVTDTVLQVARELEIAFGEATCTWSDNGVWLHQIDLSPDLQFLEEAHRLRVSSALADYLIETANNA